MTSSEIIAHQEQTGRLCISLRGMFYTAYNGSAQALARIMGYQVKQTAGSTASLPCCYAGFPASALDRVIAQLEESGARVVCRQENYLELEGISIEFNPAQMESYQVRGANKPPKQSKLSIENAVSEKILNYHLGEHTPIEAMNFLQTLQEELRSRLNKSYCCPVKISNVARNRIVLFDLQRIYAIGGLEIFT